MLLNQPKGLYLLFFTEAWERFGYYTLQTIFVLYVSHALYFSDHKAYLLMGAFSALQYITPVLGGHLADRYLGFQRAILIGGSLLALGYLIIVLPQLKFFLFGLCILILGNGFFKPNVSSIVGTLYSKDDPKRDSGFTLFYMGINIGSLIPPLFLGPLVQAYGWGAAFLLATVGMVISTILFFWGRKYLHVCSDMPTDSILNNKPKRDQFYMLLGIGILLAIFICSLFLHLAKYSNIVLIIASVLIIVWILKVILSLHGTDRKHMLVALILIIISIGFWAIYVQSWSSLMLFADRNMSPQFLGMKIDAEFTQSFNPFFIIVLSPLLSLLWPRLYKSRLNPSYPMKFALAIFSMGAGFLILALGVKWFSHNGLSSPWWLVWSYFLQTIGELVLSPIGLAMITALTPQKYVGMMMGIWFLALAAAFAIGGELATIADVPKNVSILVSQHIYTKAFFEFAYLGLALGILALLATPKLKKMLA